jgi:proprotein convertase subtilisin/kexin type 5
MYGKFCLNCNNNCKECIGPKETDCLSCDASNAKYNVFDSGRCDNKCFKDQVQVDNADQKVFPVESNKICKKAVTNNCDQSSCGSDCMFNSKYCTSKCASEKAFSYFSKECVESDKCSAYGTSFSLDTTFKDFKQCKRCIDKCKKCTDGNQAKCDECNPLFLNKFNYNLACVKSCPFKYYAELNTNKCRTCSTGCNSCRDGNQVDCLSCESDKLYYYGQCLS